MKIIDIIAYGTITFNDAGGAHFDDWSVVTDDDSRTPDADEFALMLYTFLAEQTREHELKRLSTGLSTTAVN